MWARKHKHCIECKTTESKHEAKGLCKRCYDANATKLKLPRILKKREKYRKKRQYKRIILSVVEGRIWARRLSKNIFVKVRSDRTNKVFKTPIKIKDLESNLGNIRLFKKALDEMKL